jgi:hypothetical protein
MKDFCVSSLRLVHATRYAEYFGDGPFCADIEAFQ